LAAPERPASRPAAPDGRYNTMPDEGVDIAGYLDMVRIYLLTMLDICEAA
jgi:acetylornithine deacetylase